MAFLGDVNRSHILQLVLQMGTVQSSRITLILTESRPEPYITHGESHNDENKQVKQKDTMIQKGNTTIENVHTHSDVFTKVRELLLCFLCNP